MTNKSWVYDLRFTTIHFAIKKGFINIINLECFKLLKRPSQKLFLKFGSENSWPSFWINIFKEGKKIKINAYIVMITWKSKRQQIWTCFSEISNYQNVINLRSRHRWEKIKNNQRRWWDQYINSNWNQIRETTSHRRKEKKKYDTVITFQSNEANLTQSVKTLFFYSKKENLEIINTRYSLYGE